MTSVEMMDGDDVFVTLEMADQSVRRVPAVIPPTPLLLLVLVVLLFKTADFIVVVFVIDDSVAADDTVTGLLLLLMEDLFGFLDDLLVTEIPLPLLPMMEVVLLLS